MNWKSLFGTAAAVLAVWFALGVSATAYADATFDSCTLYSRVKVGNGTQTSCAPIDTGFIPCGTTSIDAKYREWKIDSSINSCLFCSRSSSSSGPHFTYFAHVGSKARWDYDTKQDWGTAHAPSLNPNYRVIIENGKATVYTTLDRDPLSTMTGTASTFAGQYKMYLFSTYDTGYASFNNSGQYYFYYLKAYDGPIANGKLQHHYVPCKTSDDKVGVADLVEEKVLLPLQNQSLLSVDENDSLGGVRPMLDATAFSAYATFTASGYEGSEELEEFPVLVRLAENSPEGFSYADCAPNGSDIRFADADGHLIAHEIDTWNSAGESLIWVNVPKLTAATQFRMYIGGTGSVPTLPSSSVWRRAGYHLVNHNNVTAATAGMDSTGSGLVGAAHNGGLVVTKLDGAPMGMVDNQTGNNGWNLANNAKWSAHGGQVTMSLWSYRTDVTDNTNRGWMGVEGSYNLLNYPKDGKCVLRYGTTEAVNKVMPVAVGNWMHIAGVLNGTEARAYQNGVILGTGTTTAIADVGKALGVGSPNVCPGSASRNKGYLDEYRLRWGSSSADWVKAEYDTVMKSDFLEGVMGSPSVQDPEDWEYSFTIKLSDGMKSALGSGEEVDFPILVRLSEAGVSGFKYSDFSEADYSDLVFVDKDGKFLDYEVDTWDASGVSLVWVRVPSMVASTTITCRYGGPKYKHNEAKTWKKFAAVIHCGDSPKDSSVNKLNVTTNGTSATTAGVVGGGVIKATNNSIGLNLASPAGVLTSPGMFSVMAWYKRDGNGGSSNNGTHILSGSRTGFGSGDGFVVLQEKGQYISVAANNSHQWGSSTYKLEDKVWGHVVFTYSKGSELVSYFNGNKDMTKASPGTLDIAASSAPNWTFGSYANTASADSFKGEMDEIRVYDGVASAAWIAADYYQMMNAGAFVYGTVVTPDPELPKLVNVTLSVDESGNIVVSGEVKRHGGEVTITLLAEGQPPVEIEFGEVEADHSFARTCDEDDGLLKFQNYTVSVSAANGDKIAVRQISDPVKYGKVTPTDYLLKFTATPSDATKTFLDASVYENFPVLVRIPADASSALATGSEIMVLDETSAELSWELETLNPAGTSFLWVKVPSLSASTVLTVCVGGVKNDRNAPSDVWSRYVGVWHFAPSCAGDTTVPDATINGFDGTASGGTLSEHEGPWGNAAISSTVVVQSPDYDSKLDNVAVFSASGWFLMPAYPGGSGEYANLISKKTGLSWSEDKGWYVQMNQSKTTAGLVCKNNETKYSSLSDVTVNWHYFHVVSDGSTVKVYFDGKTSPDISSTYVVKASGTTLSMGSADAVADEYRIRKVASSAAEIALEYKTMKDVNFFEYSEVGPTDPNAPVINEPVLTPNDDGTFHMSVTITDNMPLEGSVKMVYGGAVTVLSTSDTAVPATYECDITPTAEDVTSVVTVRAKSVDGGSRSATSSGFYNGELKIEKVCDAVEKGLSNGIWRISRADAAHELKVALAKLDTSIATAGVDYVEFPLAAVIPEGTNSVDVMVTPIMNLEHDYDTWVDLAITNGAYRIDSVKFAARCKIINYEIPTGGNIWCATAPGKASVASNWTMGTVPDENSSVMFDGDVSQADCEWDVDATHTLKSWTQMANYHGTVTIDTTFDDEFPELKVNGDVIINGGKWTHQGNYANFGGTEKYTSKIDRKWRINVSVSGDFYLASAASIDVTGRGWGYLSDKSGNAPCHGGWSDTMNWGQDPYGDYLEPIDLGTGTASQGDQTKNGKSALGGGSVKLIVGGIADLKGDVLADGTGDKCVPRSTGTGGSVWITAKQISGDGRISTSSCPKDGNLTSDQAVGLGSGGRMALYTEEPLAKSRDKLFCSGVAYAETGSSKTKISGPGTIFIKDSTMSAGMLYIKQPSGVCGLSNTGCSTPVTGNWAFDKIILSGAVQLRVIPGFSLSVPTLDSIESEGNTSAKAAIVVPFGAQFNCGAGNFVLKSGIALTTEEYTLDGNLTLEPAAKIGAPDSVYGAKAENYDRSLKLTVTGNVTIPEGASGGATRAVALTGSVTSRYGAHGGQSLWAFAKSQSYASTDGGYDSIMNPSMPGFSQSLGFFTGGAFTLEVGGKLTLDGVISSDGGNARGNTSTWDNSSAGSGGTVNITAGSLTGKGSISADGGCGQYNYAGGAGGGRIAVCLTDEDAEFSDRWVNSIRALGMSFTSASANARASSAGTVYLVNGAQSFDYGTIYVRNDMSFARADLNTAVTCIPGVDETCDNPVMLANTSLYLDGAARVKLTSSFGESILKVANKTKLDLNGMVYTVRRAFIGDKKVPVGTYQSGDDPFGDILDDSTGGGMLRVTGYGLWVFVQ